MRKILLILAFCLCFCSCAEKGKMIKEQAVSSEVLQEQQAEVFESVTKDFDGDGTEETFQLRREGKMLKLWFVGDGGERLKPRGDSGGASGRSPLGSWCTPASPPISFWRMRTLGGNVPGR